MPAALLLFLTAASLAAQVKVAGKVADENGVAVAGARVEFRRQSAVAAVSDLAGRFALDLPAAGSWSVHAERPGFFVFDGPAQLSAGDNQIQITLNHAQEFFQQVDVAYSAPAIDLQQPAEQKQLTGVEILEVPYPASQDVRNAMPLFNGVVQDTSGRLHFNGGSSDQTYFSLDGFNVSDPVTGRFDARLNIESVRSIDYDAGRYSADKGRGSAGAVDLKTSMGDDRWRFGSTNFIPGVSTRDGLHLNKWTPRLKVSGPIARGRAWFHNGFDAFYDVDTIDGLPRGENRSRALTLSNLTRAQFNLTPANIVTASLLYNYTDADRTGLSFLEPAETTVN
ncbi:MAG: carboxypeptidase regulatory-like domain-containing protein, partial [Bryobacteraceae bacterium]